LSQQLLFYVYDRVPDKYIILSKHYETLASYLKGVQSEFYEMMSIKKKEANEAKEQIQKARENALLPFKATLDFFEAQEIAKRDRELASIDPSSANHSLQREEIEKKYQEAMATYELFYTVVSTPINTYYDSLIQDIDLQLNNAIQAVKQEQDSIFSQRYQYAKDFLAYAQKVKKEGYDAQNHLYPQLDTKSQNPITLPEIKRDFRPTDPFVLTQLQSSDILKSNYAEYLKFIQISQQKKAN